MDRTRREALARRNYGVERGRLADAVRQALAVRAGRNDGRGPNGAT